MPNAQAQLKLREVPGWAVGLCLFGLAAGLSMVLWYGAAPPFGARPSGDGELLLQFAATPARARAIVKAGGGAGLFQDGLVLDWRWFIPGYAAALAGAFGLGHLLLYRKATRLWALRALFLTPVAVAADCVENVFLWQALNRIKADPNGPVPPRAALLSGGPEHDLERNLQWASHFAQLKWALVIPLVAAALLTVVTLCSRRVLAPSLVRGTTEDRPRPVVEYADQPAADRTGLPDVILPPAAPHDWEPLSEWTAPDPARPHLAADPPDSASAHWRNRRYQPPSRKPGELGFCVSGGGIRSASVALGALQALRAELLEADYLVSVSGGGYTAGAFQLALTDARFVDAEGNPSVPRPGLARPADAFAPGSPEEDHVRRHAKYLADAPKERVHAAGAVLRGMAVSFGMLALLFTVVGQCLNAFYSRLPLTDLHRFVPRPKVFVPTCQNPALPVCPGPPETFLPPFHLYPNAWQPVLVLFGLAGLVSVAFAFGGSWTKASRPAWLRSVVKAIVWMALVVALLSIVLPAVIWFFAWLAHEQGVVYSDGRGLSVLAALTGAATAVGTWFTVVHKTVRQLTPGGELTGPLRKGGGPSLVVQVGGGWVKAAVCWLVLFLVAFFYLALMTWTAVYAGTWNIWWKAGIPIALIVLSLVIDQTTFSLHPFYRQRLAGAFAVRRAVLKGGSVGALPYDYNHEPTPLHPYAQRVDGFPQVIFAASAAVSLRNRTAPGRPAVPFTFASDYCGGPDTGWVRTETLQATAPELIGRDLTVQSAVAVSGAAFASAMGSQTMFMERLLALSNVRLGTWVPNPLYIAELAKYGPDRIMPRLPRVRRLRYQLQELVGWFSDTTPLLLCTDGGHFDNLGLVEMLRLRCRTVYVIDASGDTPPLATTLAQAVTLAYEDLGVKITFNREPGRNLLDLVPGSGKPLAPEAPMAALNARFSATCVVRGTIEYPEEVEFSPGTPKATKGTIIFVKATLTPDMPEDLLSYALREPAFPRQATFDQWFDHAQFDAYRALGYHLGTKARDLRPDTPEA
ncbi:MULTISPECIES: patatin-like phospholipase family protein [Streptomyces]|uniref:patatin-like phospholipase family protein n=1 Tax=Streptomyces TaxID=1883 RepID=UPI0013315077|nr:MULTISPECIES: patatin-like phospholipase family protein [Streptomyces]